MSNKQGISIIMQYIFNLGTLQMFINNAITQNQNKT